MAELNKKTIIGAMIIFMLSFGVNIVNLASPDDDFYIPEDQGMLPYHCDKETVDDMFCYKLSGLGVSGVNRNCYYDRDNSRKYKVCSTGWELMIDNLCPTCQDNEKECPQIPTCQDFVCEEPTVEECETVIYGGGGGSSCDNECPTCPVLTCEDGKCPSMYGFGIVNECDTGNREIYYCTDCDKSGCRGCTSRSDIELPLG